MHKKLKKRAQVTLEFTFCFIILLLILYGCVMAFRWSGVNLAERRIAHDDILTNTDFVDEYWPPSNLMKSPVVQLNPDFYTADTSMNMVFNKW